MRRGVKFNPHRWWCVGAVLLTLLGLGVSRAHAELTLYRTYGFYGITNNDPIDAGIGEAQLFVDVLNGSDINEVQFNFRNVGPNSCTITDVYFDDGTLLELAGLIDSDDSYNGRVGHSGVDFSIGADPTNLPGGNLINPPFQVSLGFSADSDPPPPSSGVEPPDEWLGVVFLLNGGGGDVYDVLDELDTGILRIGVHVQGFGNGGADSESFVNVPEPASMLLLGLGGLALRRKRRS